MLEALVLPRAAHEELKQHAEARGLVFLSTPFEEASADFLADELHLPALKVPSGELTNHPFLEHLARKGLPLLMSTGMADLADVDAAVRAIRAAGDPPLALLHCVSCYPAEPRLCNLRAMRTLADRFHVPVGFSDHTLGIEIALAAAALGASVVEKHFTLDSKAPGPDHAASLEPADLRRMVAGIRAIESALGTGIKAPAPEEAPVAAVARKSLHWRGALPAGAAIAREHLVALRPGTGVPPSELASMLGRRTLRAVPAGALATRSDWEPAAAGARA
jgi:N-acetylneuraminate synthase/N,N'-diacetyllegionaminate synthase